MSLRQDFNVISDDQLVKIHERAQAEVADCLSGGFLTLTAKYTKIAKAAERELRSRARFNKGKK